MNEELYIPRKGKKCVIYIRVSSERQVQGYSMEGQKRYLQEWAKFEGMTVSKVYVEPGKSGKNISGREVFQGMLDDISTKAVDTDYVVVFKLSRFGRNAKDILNSLTFIQRYGVNLICKEDSLDSSTSMGKMMITILSAVAEMERENIIIQTMLGREEKAKQGGWNGGSAPYGYSLEDGKLIIKEEEAEIVRLIFDKFVNGGIGYSTIAGYLNKQGIQKPRTERTQAKKFTDWSTYQVKRILDNPVYTGRVAFGRTRLEKVKGTEDEYKRKRMDEYIISDVISHEAIITDEIFEKAKMKRKETGVTGNPSVGRDCKHLLSGLLRCPMCGSAMYIDKVKWTTRDGVQRERFKYQCGHYAKSKYGQCKKNSILAEWVEQEVIKYTKLLVKNKQFAKDIQEQIGQKMDVAEIDNEIANYYNSLKKLERNKNKLERDIDGLFEDDKFAERKRKDMNKRLNKIYEDIYNIEDKISECEKKRLVIEQDVLTKENIYKILLVFDKLFDKMEKEDKRNFMESIISEIHLHPKDTWQEGKNPVKEIIYTFPVSKQVIDSVGENMASLETIALLSRKEKAPKQEFDYREEEIENCQCIYG